MNQASSRLLSAETSVTLADPDGIVEAFHAHFSGHLDMVREGNCLSFNGAFGYGVLSAQGGKFCVKLDCVDENNLVAVKSMVAEHLIEFAGDKDLDFSWQGHGAGQRIIRNLYQMRVARAFNVTPHMRRVVLSCVEIEKLMTGGFHVRLLIPPKDRTPVWPTLATNGSFAWPGGDDALSVRIYTIRKGDIARGEIEVDFVMHEGDDMPGANFGAMAQPGDIVGLIGPGGGVLPDVSRYVFAGDETALPVMSRMVEEMPAGKKVTVFAEIADEAEQQHVQSRADVAWHWLHRDGKAAGTAGLLEAALAGFDFGTGQQDLHIFVGCEKQEARSIKTLLTGRHGLPKSLARTAGYWVLGEDDGEDDH